MPENHIQKTWPGLLLPGLLAFAILASSYFIPVAGTFFIPLLPAPLAYARLRYGQAGFFAASLPCLLFVSIAGGFPVVTAFVAALAVSAYVLGGSPGRGDPDDAAVLKATLLPVLTAGPALGLYFLYSGVNPWAMLARALDQGLKESVLLYRQMGMKQADIDAAMPSLRLFARMVVDYLPAVSVCFMALTSFFCYYLLKLHARRAGLPAGNSAPMNRWTAPDQAVWGVIVPGFLMIPPVPLLRQAAGNLLAVFALVYLFQGIAVLAYLFERFKLHALLKALAVLIILLQPILLLSLWCMGLFDTWADFRKVRPKQAR